LRLYKTHASLEACVLNVLTLFPEIFKPYLDASVLGDAHEAKILETHLYQIRDFALSKHHTVDDTPYGGGAGMVMKVEPIDNALQAVTQEIPREEQHIIVLSARGRQFTQTKAQELAQSGKSLTFICGRYEGIDQRVADYLADEELSVGPYVLAGGELAALIIMEAVARLVPGVLGNPASLIEESFSANIPSSDDHIREYPQYTKPEIYKDWRVPEVLLSGNHAAMRSGAKSSNSLC